MQNYEIRKKPSKRDVPKIELAWNRDILVWMADDFLPVTRAPIAVFFFLCKLQAFCCCA